MGRKKIQIQRIQDERTRQTTFSKRKVGLVKKAIELSVLCECEVIMIGFGANQIFAYSSSDMDSLIEQYKAFDGVCEVFSNEDLDSLKPGKITTGCSIVQRKQGVSIPISKKEPLVHKVMDNNHHGMMQSPPTPHPMNNHHNNHMINNHMDMISKVDMLNKGPIAPPAFPMYSAPMGMTLPTMGNMPNPMGMGSMFNRKRKSIPGGWIPGFGLGDFPTLSFNHPGHPIASLRTPPGPGPNNPSFSLAAPSRHMKSPIVGETDDGHPKESDPEFHFAKRPKAHKEHEEDEVHDHVKAGATSGRRNSLGLSFGNSAMNFLLGDPLTGGVPSGASPGVHMESDMNMSEPGLYKLPDSLAHLSKSMDWMGNAASGTTPTSNSHHQPSFTLATNSSSHVLTDGDGVHESAPPGQVAN